MSEASSELFDDLCYQLDKQHKTGGINHLDILNLPPPLDSTFTRIIRQGSMTASEFASDLHLAPEQGEHLIKLLVDKGYLHAASAGPKTIYKVHFIHNQKKQISSNVWDSLGL
jgi:hypothetical protein